MDRAFKNIELDQFQIESAFRKYFGDSGSLKRYEMLSGGAINTTYKVRWDDEDFVLRIYARGKYLAEVESQIYDVVKNKVSVPELLFTSEISDCYPFAIFKFMDGKHLFECDSSHASKISYELGKVLAEIHSFKFPQAGLFGSDLSIEIPFDEGSSPYLDYIYEYLIEGSNPWKRLGNEKAKKVKHFVDVHRDFFPVIHNGGVLVHSDFKPVNLIWSEQKGVMVLDWEFVHVGHGLIDFGILLRHFREFPLSIGNLEKGYRDNGGELPIDWIKRVRIADFVNVVQLLERTKMFDSLIESVDLTVNNWNELDPIIREGASD